MSVRILEIHKIINTDIYQHELKQTAADCTFFLLHIGKGERQLSKISEVSAGVTTLRQDAPTTKRQCDEGPSKHEDITSYKSSTEVKLVHN